MRIGSWLEDDRRLETGASGVLADIVLAACAAHDIGNPPFGHSGEAAMGDWFAERFDRGTGLAADIDPDHRGEFVDFEGNAQGFRIITRLEMYRNEGGMRLSKGMLGAFTKYPVTSSTRRAVIAHGDASYVGLKKFGVFRSELELFKDVAATLELPCETVNAGSWWRRHPLVFIVEAADDICYNIVDLEDAFTTGELDFNTVRDLLHRAAGNPNRETAGLSQAEHIALLRALSIGNAVQSCLEAFQANYDAIMAGNFSKALTECGPMAPAFSDMKKLSRDRVLTARRKTELEVSGRRVIANVMSGVLPVFEELAGVRWNAEALGAHNQQLVRALDLDVRHVTSPDEALHALADFTSGMTDRHAVRIARMLSGI